VVSVRSRRSAPPGYRGLRTYLDAGVISAAEALDLTYRHGPTFERHRRPGFLTACPGSDQRIDPDHSKAQTALQRLNQLLWNGWRAPKSWTRADDEALALAAVHVDARLESMPPNHRGRQTTKWLGRWSTEIAAEQARRAQERAA
jgi:hypothetical protein